MVNINLLNIFFLTFHLSIDLPLLKFECSFSVIFNLSQHLCFGATSEKIYLVFVSGGGRIGPFSVD